MLPPFTPHHVVVNIYLSWLEEVCLRHCTFIYTLLSCLLCMFDEHRSESVINDLLSSL